MQFRQIPVVFARSPNHFPKVTTLLFVCSAVSFVNDKGQRDTYQYVKSGNGQIAHINGIMSELIYLSDIRQKIISAKKIESLTLQSVTVRCGERSATFFIDPALTSDECLQVEQMLTSPSVAKNSRSTTASPSPYRAYRDATLFCRKNKPISCIFC